MTEKYSRLNHLIHAIDMNRDKAKRVVSMFSAYFDESENPAKQTVMVVAGYAAHFVDWLRFEEEWLGALGRANVKHFHMRDFVVCKREFKDWKDDDERRRKFLDELSGIIVKYVRNSFSYTVEIAAYNAINAKYMMREYLGTPYAMCASSCARAAREWAESLNSRMICIFENRDTDRADFRNLMERRGEPDPLFGTRDDYAQLEAADFIAWSHLRMYTPIEEKTAKVFGSSLKRLLNVPKQWRKYTSLELEGTCNDIKVPLRQSNVHFRRGRMKARLWGHPLTQEEIERRFNSQ